MTPYRLVQGVFEILVTTKSGVFETEFTFIVHAMLPVIYQMNFLHDAE
jgi:hypothetical protein